MLSVSLRALAKEAAMAPVAAANWPSKRTVALVSPSVARRGRRTAPPSRGSSSASSSWVEELPWPGAGAPPPLGLYVAQRQGGPGGDLATGAGVAMDGVAPAQQAGGRQHQRSEAAADRGDGCRASM